MQPTGSFHSIIKVALAICLISVIIQSGAQACSCAATPPPRETYHKSTFVFLGRVTSIKTELEYVEKVTVVAEKTWKGKIGRPITLRNIGGNCPKFPFVSGKRYLFYLPPPRKGKPITVFVCSWIAGEANAKSGLAWL